MIKTKPSPKVNKLPDPKTRNFWQTQYTTVSVWGWLLGDWLVVVGGWLLGNELESVGEAVSMSGEDVLSITISPKFKILESSFTLAAWLILRDLNLFVAEILANLRACLWLSRTRGGLKKKLCRTVSRLTLLFLSPSCSCSLAVLSR